MSEYTKGAWEVGEGKLDGGYLGVFVKGSVMTSPICRVSPIKAMNEEDVYNAYLIAAAPELLEALRGLVEGKDKAFYVSCEGEYESILDKRREESWHLWDNARAAIAKAEGKV